MRLHCDLPESNRKSIFNVVHVHKNLLMSSVSFGKDQNENKNVQ